MGQEKKKESVGMIKLTADDPKSRGSGSAHMIDRRTEEQKNPTVEQMELGLFPDNVYGYPWDSGFIERFIDRKMCDKRGNPWKRKILV